MTELMSSQKWYVIKDLYHIEEKRNGFAFRFDDYASVTLTSMSHAAKAHFFKCSECIINITSEILMRK